MRSRANNSAEAARLPGAGRRYGLGCLGRHRRPLALAWVFLSLVLFVPVLRGHSRHADACALAPGIEQAMPLMLVPERLALASPETRQLETASLWPASIRTTWMPPRTTVVTVVPALPLPRGTSPFPLRV